MKCKDLEIIKQSIQKDDKAVWDINIPEGQFYVTAEELAEIFWDIEHSTEI